MEARGASFLQVAKGGLPSLRDMESHLPLPSSQQSHYRIYGGLLANVSSNSNNIT